LLIFACVTAVVDERNGAAGVKRYASTTLPAVGAGYVNVEALADDTEVAQEVVIVPAVVPAAPVAI